MRERSDELAGLRSVEVRSRTTVLKESVWVGRADRQVLAEMRDAHPGRSDGVPDDVDVPRDGELVVMVRRAAAPKPRHLRLDPGPLHETGITRGQYLGHGKLFGPRGHVLQAPDGAIASVDKAPDA